MAVSPAIVCMAVVAALLLDGGRAFSVQPFSRAAPTRAGARSTNNGTPAATTMMATRDQSKPLDPEVAATVSPAYQPEPCPFTEEEIITLTKRYVKEPGYEDTDQATLIADDFVFRGPVVGPLASKSLYNQVGKFTIDDAYPDMNIKRWGFSVDPDDPYRCYAFQRSTGTHTGTFDIGNTKLEATGNKLVGPPEVYSYTWNKDGKLKYQTIGYPADRFSGNTGGKGAVFGMMHNAGLKLNPHPGSKTMLLLQRLGHMLKASRSWSPPEELPKWWKSKAMGAMDNSTE